MSQFQQWIADLDRIREEVTVLAWSKAIHQRVREIVSSNGVINTRNRFYSWLSLSYVDSQLVSVRRQLDRDKRSVSLENLIESMTAGRAELTREAHLSLYRDGLERAGNDTFDGLAGTAVDVYPTKKLHDAKEVLDQVRAIHGKYMNKRLAHSDREVLQDKLPTYRELDEAVDQLEQLVIHFHLLLTAQDYRSLVPVVEYDWEAIFRQPWLPPREPRRGA